MKPQTLSQCDQCVFTSHDVEDLKSHKQAEHKALRVDIDTRDQVDIMCDQCDYKCRLNIQLKKHKVLYHKEKKETHEKYQCDVCSYASDYLLHMWDHRQSKHPDQTPHFSPSRPQDMALSLIAEQNIDIAHEVEGLKRDTKNSLIEFADKMQECFEAISQDINHSFRTSHSALSDISAKIEQKITSMDNKLMEHLKKAEKERLEESK